MTCELGHAKILAVLQVPISTPKIWDVYKFMHVLQVELQGSIGLGAKEWKQRAFTFSLTRLTAPLLFSPSMSSTLVVSVTSSSLLPIRVWPVDAPNMAPSWASLSCSSLLDCKLIINHINYLKVWLLLKMIIYRVTMKDNDSSHLDGVKPKALSHAFH